MITHTPDRVIDLFDDVIVLAKDASRVGRLAYYGPITESYDFFGKKSMEEILLCINQKDEGGVTVKDIMNIVEEQGMRDTVLQKLSEANSREDFVASVQNLAESWRYLLMLGVVFAIVTVVFLEFIDRDKR